MIEEKVSEKNDPTIDSPELDRVSFRGHKNILGLHRNTIEITKDCEISRRADCIVGVMASKSCSGLNKNLKSWILSGKWMEFEIKTGEVSFKFTGRGGCNLDLLDEKEIVLRKSDYASSRTMAINCSHSAVDIPRTMIERLQDPLSKGVLIVRCLSERKENDFVWSLP